MAFGDRYVQPMLDRFGVSVTIGAVTVKCLRDDADEQTLGDEWASLTGKALVVRCKTFTNGTPTFPTLAVGVAMTVDGVAMSAAQVQRFGPDGETTRIVAVRVK